MGYRGPGRSRIGTGANKVEMEVIGHSLGEMSVHQQLSATASNTNRGKQQRRLNESQFVEPVIIGELEV